VSEQKFSFTAETEEILMLRVELFCVFENDYKYKRICHATFLQFSGLGRCSTEVTVIVSVREQCPLTSVCMCH